MEFKKTELSNGLTIVGEVNSSAKSAAVGFFVRTGSRDESDEINGVSHFLEHMLFKGTEKLDAFEVNAAFDRLGAKFNASTSEENTVYYAAVLPEYLFEVTDLWTQLMRPSLRTEDFDMEKNVIKEEIAMYKDLPQWDVVDRCRSLHFKGHPCAHSVLGTDASIDALTAEQMREYFERRYSPDNVVLACCGAIDFEKICGLAEEKCGGWQPSRTVRELSSWKGTFEKQRVEKENLVCEHVCLISPIVSFQDDRRFAASLMSTIVGDETGSRYFWALVDSALAETAGMQCERMDGVGALYSYIRCNPDKAGKVMETIGEIFETLSRDGVSEDELTKAKNKVLSEVTIRSEQPMGRLGNLGSNWVYLQQYRSVAETVRSIKAVTVADINGIIEEYQPGNFTRLSLGPQQE